MTTKEKLQLKKIELQLNKSAKKGHILPFDDDFYNKLRNYYHGSMPANVFIKFFKTSFGIGLGLCYERSLIISSIFDDAKLVRGDRLDYIIHHGEKSFHWWVESGGWCYDPTSLYRYKKEDYYRIFKPINLKEMNKREIVNSYYYKNMINRYPKELLFIPNLIQFEAKAQLLNKLYGDDEMLKELEIFRNKINYYDTTTDEEILENVRKMKEEVELCQLS